MSANELPHILGQVLEQAGPKLEARREDPALVVGRREIAHLLHAAANDLGKVEIHLGADDAARLRTIIQSLRELERGFIGPSRPTRDR